MINKYADLEMRDSTSAYVALDWKCPPAISSIISQLVARCVRMRSKRGAEKLRSIIRKAKQNATTI